MVARSFWFAIVVLGCILVQSESNLLTPPELRVEPEYDVLNKWNELGPKLQKLAQGFTDTLWPIFNRTVKEYGIGPNCVQGVNRLFHDFVNLKLWAVQMFDATGYHGGGMVFNNWLSAGDFEHCLNVRAPMVKNTDQRLKGQFCMVHLRPPMPPKTNTYRKPATLPILDNLTTNYELVETLKKMSWDFYDRSFRYGVCVPSSCTDQDVQILANKVSNYVGFVATVKDCQTDDMPPLASYHKYILGALLGFVMIGLICSFIPEQQNPKSIVGKIRSTFSVTYHLSQTFTASKASDPKTTHINGLKCVGTLWMVIIHFLLVAYFSRAYHGHERTKSFCQSFTNQITANSIISVDTFFFCTAVILTYIKFRKGVPQRNGVKLSDIKEITTPIIRRYLRILPMCLVITGLTFLLPLASQGPIWKEMVESYNDNCLRNWWKILYFGTNFESMDNMCGFQLWYISVDLQLFVLFALFSYLYCRNKRLAYGFLIVSSVTSTLWTGIVNFLNDDQPALIFHNINLKNLLEALRNHYQSPIAHVCVYSWGIATGLCLTKIKDIKLSKKTLFGGWTVSLTLGYYVIFSSYNWNNGILPTRIEAAAYVVVSKFFWAVSHSWLVMICATGNCDSLNKILSSTIFDYGSRIMFSFYVSNIPVILFFAASNQSLTDLRYANLWSQALLMTIVTLMVSLALHVFYERPLSELVSYITPNEPRVTTAPKDSNISLDKNSNQILSKLSMKNKNL